MWHYNIVHENANIIQTSEIVKVQFDISKRVQYNLWKRFHFTWNGSRTSLEGFEGKVGEDDQHADGSECW